MSRMIDLTEMKPGEPLPQDSQFFDFFEGDTLVAHLRLPRVLDRDRRAHVTLYTQDRTVAHWQGLLSFPLGRIRAHARELRNAAR
ncbi:MAG: hypothetical protein O9972_39640 [Burkholderiales bacterium]|nr:hypothetical protein [Burkholderiales bacterium]